MSISRRQLLAWFAVAPALPRFLVDSAHAAAQTLTADQPIVVVVRMLGGNDGLNTVVPIADDRYFKARPTIALARRDTLPLPGGELALNAHLVDVQRLIDDGVAGIVQSVGYPKSSRSHARSTEIWETGSTANEAPRYGWLGRYLDHHCDCLAEPIAGIQFGNEPGRTLASRAGRSRSIGHPQLLLDMQPDDLMASKRGPRGPRFDYLLQVENALGQASRQLHRAAKGTGRGFDYPNTAFGQSLRWAGDMIETGSPTRVYYVTIGSFDTPESASFDTHSDQVAKHRLLFSELGQGLRAFTSHLKRAGQFDRTLLLTFSDFGRLVAENKTGGTEHGDASVLFYAGGKVRPGVLGQPADLGTVRDGAIQAAVDFRQVYADVLTNWLRVAPGTVLDEPVAPFRITDIA